MRSKRATIVAVVGAVLLAACTPAPSRSPAVVEAEPSVYPSPTPLQSLKASPSLASALPAPTEDLGPDPVDREFDAALLGNLPAGRLIPIDDATVKETDVGRWLVLTFEGGPPYTAGDMCTHRYVPWFSPHEAFVDVVNVAVVEVRRPDGGAGASPSAVATCDPMAVQYTFRLRLELDRLPISQVIDRAGGTFYLISGTGVIEDLPPGWGYQLSFDLPESAPRWQGQVYASEDVSGPPYEGRHRVVLYEAFPASPDYGRTRVREAKDAGAIRENVVVQGEAGRLWVEPASGRMTLVWTYGGKSSVMIGYRSDLSRAAFLRAADSISLCCG